MNEFVPPKISGATWTAAVKRNPRVGLIGSFRLSYRYAGVSEDVVPLDSTNFCAGAG